MVSEVSPQSSLQAAIPWSLPGMMLSNLHYVFSNALVSPKLHSWHLVPSHLRPQEWTHTPPFSAFREVPAAGRSRLHSRFLALTGFIRGGCL